MKPFRRTAGDKNCHDVRDRETQDGQHHRRDAPLQTASGADRVQRDVGRHVPLQENTRLDAGDTDRVKREHSPLFVIGDKETRGTAPVEASQVIHRIQRWIT